jgi:hypothetical protein
MKLAGLDLARDRDYAAIVVGEIVEGESFLKVLGAKAFPHLPYHELQSEVARIYSERELLKIVIDATNEKAFAESLSRIGLNIEETHFTAPLKNDMVSYLLILRGQRRLAIPTSGPFIDELRQQMREQERILTTSTIRYQHPEGRHDDLFWALCMMCYGAKPWLEGLVDYRIYPVGNTI